MSQAFQPASKEIYKAQKPVRDRAYLQFIKRLPCVACLKTWNVDPAHTGPHGMAQKSSDASCIPLCRACHREFDAAPYVFAEKHGLDIPALILQFGAAFVSPRGLKQTTKLKGKTQMLDREISLDEGYRPGEPIKPFYAEALPCESCGKPVDSRKPAAWDPSLHVGPCCEFSLNLVPDVPTCESLWPALEHCVSVREVEIAMEAHRLCCGFCRGERRAA